MTKPRILMIAAFATIILLSGIFFLRTSDAPSSAPEITDTYRSPADDVSVVAQNLAIPWEIAFLPDGDMLVTERPGTLKRIGKNKQTYPIAGVAHRGEGGLLGLALHPRFAENGWLYLYLTTRLGDGLINRLERYRLADDTLTERKEIISNIPGASIHDGGRIAFSPDGYLFMTTGDAGASRLAQDKNSLAGKILRLRDDGSIPADNPFGNAVWTYGHRNPQGLAWAAMPMLPDITGKGTAEPASSGYTLWATEHGRSVPLSGYDEVNLIEKGKNYGWPDIQGDTEQSGMEKPMIHSGPHTTWAPAGAAFLNGSLFFSGLKGEALYALPVSSDGIGSLKEYFSGQFGRMRAVVAGPDNFLYLSTSNTDGRGTAQPDDDKIIKINPRALESR